MSFSLVLAQSLTATPAGQGSWLTQPFFDFLAWVLNPATMIAAAFKVFSVVMGLMAKLIPAGVVKDTFNNLAQLSRAIPIQAGWGVVTYLTSPIINPTILNVVVSVRILIWLLSLVVRLTVWCVNGIVTNFQ